LFLRERAGNFNWYQYIQLRLEIPAGKLSHDESQMFPNSAAAFFNMSFAIPASSIIYPANDII
jgi:hypothetical protein